MQEVLERNIVNGIDVDAVHATIAAVTEDPVRAQARFRVATRWAGQTRSVTTIDSFDLGGERIARSFHIASDEPFELLGTNTAPNPQELLMAALNACMTVGYVAVSSLHGIALEHVEIETVGQLDLRGFLGLDASVPAGYEQIDYVVRIAGDGTPEQFEAVHAAVMATSPNFFNLARPVRLSGTLVIG